MWCCHEIYDSQNKLRWKESKYQASIFSSIVFLRVYIQHSNKETSAMHSSHVLITMYYPLYIYGGFLKWRYPTTMGCPTKNDHFGVFWGYHHLWKHPYKWLPSPRLFKLNIGFPMKFFPNHDLFLGPPPPATSVAQRHAGLDEDDQRLLGFFGATGMAAVNGL